jgi:hypothetical protein
MKLYRRQMLAQLRIDKEMCIFHNYFHYFFSPVYYGVQQFESSYIFVSKFWVELFMYSKIFTAAFMQIYIAYDRSLLLLYENTFFYFYTFTNLKKLIYYTSKILLLFKR